MMTPDDRPPFAAIGRIVGLQRSPGGVPKTAVDRALVSANGMEGDRQRNRRYHGGPTRALCLYSQDLIDKLAAEGHPVARGVLGENVTIAGVPWDRMTPGTRLLMGEVEVEVTSYAAPCKVIAYAFADGQSIRIGQKPNPGWSRVYVSILREGQLAVDDPVRLISD